jgi:hypothetical protein
MSAIENGFHANHSRKVEIDQHRSCDTVCVWASVIKFKNKGSVRIATTKLKYR